MPRSQKGKRHARGKHNRAQSDEKACESIQKEAETSEEPSASSQSLNDTESSRIPTELKTAPLSTNELAIACLRFCNGISDENCNGENSKTATSTKYHCEARIQQLVTGVLQFLIYNYNMKQFTTKEEILKIIPKKYENYFPEILKKANEKLDDVFAVEVREVSSSQPSYNLISKLKLPNNGRIRAGKGLPKTGFLMRILSIIFIKKNHASEEYIWNILKKRQIYPGKKHFVYGEPRKLMTQDLVRLKYLEYQQVAGSDPPRYEFLWGPEAYTEMTKTKVLQFLDKIKKSNLNSFPEFYEDVFKDEQEQAKTRDAAKPGTSEEASKIPNFLEMPSIFKKFSLPREKK